jgi:predicted TIM-barrel fold metal-dependent hydrolase
MAASPRFRGIRHAASSDADPAVLGPLAGRPPGLYRDARFCEGFAQLAPLGLSFDAWLLEPQLDDLIDLARAFPDTAIVLNHLGGPLGIGPYAGQGEAVFARWRTDMAALAACPNVSVKLGGLGMRIGPFDFHRRPQPAGSAQLAQAWQPWVDHAIACFGAARCMFESNFPVDQASTGYTVLWNAFKRLAAAGSADEQAALLAGTARRVYRLDEV